MGSESQQVAAPSAIRRNGPPPTRDDNYMNKIGRNDPCPCGSQRKFKKCCLPERVKESASSAGLYYKLAEIHKKIMDKGTCLYPSCPDKSIRSHTIQRAGSLSSIAKDGHVLTAINPANNKTIKDWEIIKPNRVGIKKASTFRGFCERHDSEVFSLFEDDVFSCRIDQISRLSFRSRLKTMFFYARRLSNNCVMAI